MRRLAAGGFNFYFENNFTHPAAARGQRVLTPECKNDFVEVELIEPSARVFIFLDSGRKIRASGERRRE